LHAGETADSETADSITSVYCNHARSTASANEVMFTASDKLLSDGANMCCIVHTADIVTEIVHTPINSANSSSSSKHSKYKSRSSSHGSGSGSSSSNSSSVTTRQYIVTTLNSWHMFNNPNATAHTISTTASATAADARPMDVDSEVSDHA
jgi:hypothetical protein